MHRIFTVCDVIYAILEQYLLLDHPGERPHSPLPYRALLRLACIRVFSEQALQELWRNAGLIPLDSLPVSHVPSKRPAFIESPLGRRHFHKELGSSQNCLAYSTSR